MDHDLPLKSGKPFERFAELARSCSRPPRKNWSKGKKHLKNSAGLVKEGRQMEQITVNRVSHHPLDFALDIFHIAKRALWAAHCLQLDVVGTHNDHWEAIDLCEQQIDYRDGQWTMITSSIYSRPLRRRLLRNFGKCTSVALTFGRPFVVRTLV
jgi:hypothetical protein